MLDFYNLFALSLYGLFFSRVPALVLDVMFPFSAAIFPFTITYLMPSSRESGDGRYDICLYPEKENLPGIIIEFIAAKNLSPENLKKLSQKALKQIEDRYYDTGLYSGNTKSILKYAIAFSGKM